MVNPGSFPGARGEFIRAQTELYAESVKDSHVADTLADIQRRFFKRFSVTLGDDNEPSEEWLAQVDDNAPDEELRFPNIEGMDKVAADTAVAEYTHLVARTKFKKDQIKRRLHYIYVKNRDAESDFDKAAKDPISSITSKLLGIELKLPRKRTAYNVWGPKHRAEVDPVFSERVEQLGARKEQHAAIRSAVYKDLFESLPMDTQKRWSTIAEREHEQAVADVKKKFKNSLSFSPEDRQRVIAALPKFIEPILDAIGEYTGWKASFIAGGPEPADGGRLNMISIHSGLTLGPVKMDFGRAQKSAYKSHIAPAFGAFLKKSYSIHDCRASALPKDHSSISISDVAGDEDVAMQVHTFESDAEHEKMHKPKRLFEEIAKSGKSTKPSQPPTGTPSPRVRFVPPLGKTKSRVLPVKDSALVKLGPSPLSQFFTVAGTDATSSSDLLPAASASSPTATNTADGPRAATSTSSNLPATVDDDAENPSKTHSDGKSLKVGSASKDPTTPAHLRSTLTFATAATATKDPGHASPSLEPSIAAAALATSSATTFTSAAKVPETRETHDNPSVASTGIPRALSTAAADPADPFATTASAANEPEAREDPFVAPISISNKLDIAGAGATPATPPAAFNGVSVAAAVPLAVASSATATGPAKQPATLETPDNLSFAPIGTSSALSTTPTNPAYSSATAASAAKEPAASNNTSIPLSAASNELSIAAAAPAASSSTLKEVSNLLSATLNGASKDPTGTAAGLATSSAANATAASIAPSAPALASTASTSLKPCPTQATPLRASPRSSPPASLPPSPQGSPQRMTAPVRFSGAATVPNPSEVEPMPAKGRKRKGAPGDKENAQEPTSKRLKTASAVSLGKRKAGAESDVANKRQRTGGDQPFAASVPEGCPAWVRDKALKLLTAHDLGPQWRSLVDAWIAFEQGFSFVEKKKPFLAPAGRPAAIAEWIKWGRLPTRFPDIGSLDKFESSFNAWWRGLQPHWQSCSGINGILSVLAGLFFWGYNASDAGSVLAWDAAVANVLHALNELAKGD